MSSASGILDLPRRLTLSGQAAAAIRKAIAANLWQDFLPSERQLCALLQVSRPTIRTALLTLANERRIEIRHGKRVRLLRGARAGQPAAHRLITLVSHQPLSRQPTHAYQGISEMRAQLAKHGFTTGEFVCPEHAASTQRRKLEAFVTQHRPFCCVLLSVGREVQQWFAQRSIPALVLGSCHTDVTLPSLDVDYRAVCRHAAGVFCRQGHERIAFVVPDSGVAGDLASETGFLEGAGSRPGLPAIRPEVVRHDGTVADLAGRLQVLFRAPAPPTALLVAKPNHTLAVIAHLLQHGIRVPEQVSLIARDHDPLFENVLSHYAFAGETFAHRLSRLMLQLVGEGRLPAEPHRIFPRYVNRDTVKSRAR